MRQMIEPSRFAELMHGQADLTSQEISDGWHFCPDWDGLLTRFGEHGCPCRPLPAAPEVE